MMTRTLKILLTVISLAGFSAAQAADPRVDLPVFEDLGSSILQQGRTAMASMQLETMHAASNPTQAVQAVQNALLETRKEILAGGPNPDCEKFIFADLGSHVLEMKIRC